jgi:hypothetical protein
LIFENNPLEGLHFVLFSENHPFLLSNALEVSIMSSTLCFRGQCTFLFFAAEYAICPYLARPGNLFDLRLIRRSIDGS